MVISNEFDLKGYIKVLEKIIQNLDNKIYKKVMTDQLLKEYKDRLVGLLFKKFSLNNLTHATSVSNPYKEFPKIKWQKFDIQLNTITGTYKKSIQIIKVAKNKFMIFTDVKYASAIEFGTIIRARKRSYLAVPLNPEFYKTSPTKHKLIKVRKILYKKIAKNKYKPAYLLTKQVKIKAHYSWKKFSKIAFKKYILKQLQENYYNTIGKWLIGEDL